MLFLHHHSGSSAFFTAQFLRGNQFILKRLKKPSLSPDRLLLQVRTSTAAAAASV
jgi:hypothetical protein